MEPRGSSLQLCRGELKATVKEPADVSDTRGQASWIVLQEKETLLYSV